jgi:hypothetical protein
MNDDGGRMKSTPWSALTCQRFGLWLSVATKAVTSYRTPKRWVFVLVVALFSFACATNQGSRNLPPEVESTIGTISEEIAAERYDKIYNDASELWRQDATLEESTATFKKLRTKLGLVESRMLQYAREEQNSGGPLKGHVYVVAYRTKFQNGEAMETFTLVERDGRWLLARYFVNSTALK